LECLDGSCEVIALCATLAFAATAALRLDRFVQHYAASKSLTR
jgi:hypothetical protein